MSVQVLKVSADAVVRHGMPFMLAALCLYFAPQAMQSVSLPDVVSLVTTLPIWVWMAAAACTAISFQAVGQYDVLARRHLGLMGSDAAARHNGMVAVALSQTLGFGLITGSLARLRLRPDESVLRAGQITALVSMFFLIGLVTTVACASLTTGIPAYRTAGGGVLLTIILGIGFLTLWRPRLRLRHRQIAIPSLSLIWASILWAGVDILAAAAAFYMLFPADVQIAFLTFLPVFGLALAAGILSGVPGGVGPFELVLLALTAPGMSAALDPTHVMTAIIGFRVIYFLVPAAIAMLLIVRPTARPVLRTPPRLHSAESLPRAETAVITQNAGKIVTFASGVAAVWPTGNSLVSLFDPIKSAGPAWFKDFGDHAYRAGLLPVIYKCSARTAAAARGCGWISVKVAQDAMISPATFDTRGSKCAGLRRKLRKATAAGVTVVPLRPDHLRALSRIDAAWQARCGSARGGIMGRFCPQYLNSQHVLVAEHQGIAVAFISLHRTQAEWALDLMRDDREAPDGTMYLLVHTAIQHAKAAQVPALSLAAVPADRDDDMGVWGASLCYLREKYTAKGLYQFKSAFAPQWKPLYLVAPNRFGLVLGALDLLREILRPASIAPQPVVTRTCPAPGPLAATDQG